MFQETEPFYISGGTSKAPNTKIYYTSPTKVMNKFFWKHFRIIVSTFSINWIKQYYLYIKILKVFFCVQSFFSFYIFFIISSPLNVFFIMLLTFPEIVIHISKKFSSFIIKYKHLVLSEYLLYILISGKNIHLYFLCK